ncbi:MULTISPECIES: hypothetical protein [Pseudomonas]|jgi:hypothetical protein|uniref:Uncharacterized protein n=3 Tax=Pseudomonas TaxID=286 RepID=A0A1L7NP04_PSEPU|nr:MULTISPECIES: hypothetical protein [Pseudomonas]RJT91558.1 hypothetical protein D6T65_18540 [Arthrobacter frigidicola]HCF2574554.1 hypothetical protein [Pseudomonas aeruginosa]AGN82402.1 hypothetical protein L483_15825 [Pseudomonas putida H8234]ELS0926870.1 hypothetical protein [Pseudomonas putida]ENY78147.1 hypothetical protein C206_08429 [Pseudomonas putida TRO1]
MTEELKATNPAGAHPLQAVIDELMAAEVRVTGCENAYKLLYKLCKLKGMQMNGSAGTAAGNGGISKTKVVTQARQLLKEYLSTGLIVLPAHIKGKGSEHKYKHDGDPEAGRNFNREGWRAPLPPKPKRTKPAKDQSLGGIQSGQKQARKTLANVRKMATIEAYAKEHSCTITQAMIALM